MELNKSKEEWFELIHKEKIIDRLNAGEKFSAINIDLGFEANSDALRKAIKRLGYKKDKQQGLYYLEHQEGIIEFMNSVDIEATVEEISMKRYYRCTIDPYSFWEGELKECLIDKEVYEEFDEVSQQYGCDIPEDLIHMILLEWLNKNKPMNKTREHLIRYMKESGFFSTEEMYFILRKEKEGYDLKSLVYRGEDDNILELKGEELQLYRKRE
ncbi:hypothetical protein FDB54_06695 [Clostridium botulinum]|nr:hypothetical protein [Clostridium botulinum]